jgi:hypothetical protein
MANLYAALDGDGKGEASAAPKTRRK